MEHQTHSSNVEELPTINEEEKSDDKEEKLIELDEDPSPLIKIPRTTPRSRLQMQLQRPWVSKVNACFLLLMSAQIKTLYFILLGCFTSTQHNCE